MTRNWKKEQELADNQTAAEARKASLEREAQEFAARRRCRCKAPLITRMYLNAGFCVMCSLPRYE